MGWAVLCGFAVVICAGLGTWYDGWKAVASWCGLVYFTLIGMYAAEYAKAEMQRAANEADWMKQFDARKPKPIPQMRAETTTASLVYPDFPWLSAAVLDTLAAEWAKGKSFSQRTYRNLLTEGELEQSKRMLLMRGKLRWKGREPRQGLVWTTKGELLMEQIHGGAAKETPPPPSPKLPDGRELREIPSGTKPRQGVSEADGWVRLTG